MAVRRIANGLIHWPMDLRRGPMDLDYGGSGRANAIR